MKLLKTEMELEIEEGITKAEAEFLIRSKKTYEAEEKLLMMIIRNDDIRTVC